MSEWKKVRLGDVADYVTDKSEVMGLALEDYISTENMLPNKGGISLASSVPSYGSVTEFCQGDVLVSNIRPYFKKIWKATRDGFCSNDILALRVKNCICDSFLFSALSNDAFFDYVMASAKGTKMPRGDKQQILEYPILLPPLPTQRKIAAVLGALDDKIENNRKICANLEAQAQAIFKSWFVDFEPFGGKMPQGWKMGKLGDVADITMGQSPDGKSLNENGDGTTFFQGRAEFGNRYPTKRLSTTEPKRMAQEGDVLLSVRAPVGDLNIALENCCIGRGLAAIRAKAECVDPDVARPPRPCGKGEGALATSRRCQSFIYCLLRSMKPQFDLYEGAGTIFGSINKDSLHGLSCLVPDEKALQDFEGVVSSLDCMYRERELESRSLAATRDALLPKLMSGEIDVEKVEVA